MKIEILFPEFCNLFGDNGNVKYLKLCLPDAEFVNTHFTNTPLFVSEKPDLIYMGPMSENAQKKVIDKLSEYKQRLSELIDSGVPMLFTGNASEVFANYIKVKDGEKTDGLGLIDFYAEREKILRYNGIVLGEFEGFPIEGFKSQFSYGFGDNSNNAFIKVERGIGLNKESKFEGFRINNMFATYLLGPLLVINPKFTRYLLDLMGAENIVMPFEKELTEAFEIRLKEFRNPKVSVE